MLFGKDEVIIRNINRYRNTLNRYNVDSNSFWREQLHPRIINLEVDSLIRQLIVQRVDDFGVWNFPVDEQSVSNTKLILYQLTLDYLSWIEHRRSAKYAEPDGYWTIENIKREFAYAYIMILWDTFGNLLTKYYPLVSDDLRHRSGSVNINSNRKMYHSSDSIVNTGDNRQTSHTNFRDKTINSSYNNSHSTNDSRLTSNNITIQDTFLSPQDRGVTPSRQGESVLENEDVGYKGSLNMGVEHIVNNADNASFTTQTGINNTGNTDTELTGSSNATNAGGNEVRENDEVFTNDKTSSNKEARQSVSGEDLTGSGKERKETLDIVGVLQGFYNLYRDTLIMEIDNRMLPYFLNMRMPRFRDFRVNRGEFI